MIESRWLTVSEAAERLRVGPATVRRYIDQGRLPSIRLSARAYRIDRAAFEAFVASLSA